MALLYGAIRVDHSITGLVLSAHGVSVRIVPDCTPAKPTAVLWSAMAAYPAAWKWKALGSAIGGLALWLFNMARVAALLVVLKVRPDWFQFIDAYLWQAFTLVTVVAMFLLWIRSMPKEAAQ